MGNLGLECLVEGCERRGEGLAWAAPRGAEVQGHDLALEGRHRHLFAALAHQASSQELEGIALKVACCLFRHDEPGVDGALEHAELREPRQHLRLVPLGRAKRTPVRKASMAILRAAARLAARENNTFFE